MNDIHAEDYPELEMFFLWLIRYFENSFNPVITIGLDNQVEFAALNYLQKHNLGYAIADKTLSMEMCRQIFDIKMEELLNRVIIEGVDEERLKVFILHLMEKYNFKRIEYEDVNQSFRDEIGINLSSILSAWYKNIGVPNYIVETFKVQRVGEDRVDRASSARVYFKIFNDSDVDGIVNIQSSNAPFIPDMTIMKSCETREVNLRFRIPAKTGKEVSLLLSDSPEYYALKLNACGNIPNSMYTRLDNFIGELDTLSYVREFDQTRIQIDTNEIIVDNEDAGFQVINSGTFYHLLEGGKQNITDKYTNMTHWLIPDDHWRYFIDYNAYGKFVRSAVIRNSGKGMTCAEWSVDLKRKGRYEVFVYLPKFTYSKVFTKNRNPDINSLPFTYTISSTDGENEITIQTKQDKEWVSLGVYNYTPGHYSVKLSDKGEADYSVVADAVKWVYIE